jgi:hypothetical protein
MIRKLRLRIGVTGPHGQGSTLSDNGGQASAGLLERLRKFLGKERGECDRLGRFLGKHAWPSQIVTDKLAIRWGLISARFRTVAGILFTLR